MVITEAVLNVSSEMIRVSVLTAEANSWLTFLL